MNKKHILFLGGFFGENELPNGICAHAVIRELRQRGHEVSFLAMNDGYQKEEEVLDGVYVKRVLADETTRLVSWKKRHHSQLSQAWFRFRMFLKDIRAFCFLWVWPFNAPISYFCMRSAAKQMIRERNIDTLICLYTPFNAVLAGHSLKKKYKGVNFVVYFLDSLSGGVFPKLTSQEWVGKQGKRWERRLLDNADAICIMKAHEAHHQRYSARESYYSRIRVLDIPLVQPGLTVTEPGEIHLPSEKVNLVYMGSLKRNLKNPSYLLKLFLSTDIPNAVLTFVGNAGDCADMLEQARKRAPERIQILGAIRHAEIASVLVQADVLVNIGSTNTCQIPCKIFEYMSTGKPILSTYASEQEPSIPYLREYAHSLLLAETDVIRKEDRERITAFLKKLPPDLDVQDLRDKYYRCTPAAFCDMLDNLGTRVGARGNSF